MTENSKDKSVTAPIIDRRDFIAMALSPQQGITIMLFICPFCYSIMAPPSGVVFTDKHRCKCGAAFHKMGYASKSKVKLEN